MCKIGVHCLWERFFLHKLQVGVRKKCGPHWDLTLAASHLPFLFSPWNSASRAGLYSQPLSVELGAFHTLVFFIILWQERYYFHLPFILHPRSSFWLSHLPKIPPIKKQGLNLNSNPKAPKSSLLKDIMLTWVLEEGLKNRITATIQVA